MKTYLNTEYPYSLDRILELIRALQYVNGSDDDSDKFCIIFKSVDSCKLLIDIRHEDSM